MLHSGLLNKNINSYNYIPTFATAKTLYSDPYLNSPFLNEYPFQLGTFYKLNHSGFFVPSDSGPLPTFYVVGTRWFEPYS